MIMLTQRTRTAALWLCDQAAKLLCPSWRWMTFIAASMLLLESAQLGLPLQGHLHPWQGMVCTLTSFLGFFLIWVASRPTQPAWYAAFWQRTPRPLRWPGWRGLLTLVLLVNTWHTMTWHISDLLDGNYHTDAMAYIHMDADLVLHGQNPFTADSAFWTAALRWPNATATPLLGSTTFGDNPRNYPSFKEMRDTQILEAVFPALRSNDYDPGIVHNYPGGIILMAVPFVWAGLPSILWLNMILFAVMVGMVIARAPKEDRLPLGLVLIASPELMDRGIFVNFDVDCLVFALAAWMWMDKRVASALLLGFSCAVKQVAWFLAPFYLLEVGRRYGWQEAAKRGGIAGIAFLVPNLPFIIASPGAWLHGILIPMTDHNFPLGFGPITLALSGNIPFVSPLLWLGLVVLAYAAFFVYQWRRQAVTSDGLIFALLPLMLSWRSPMDYFDVIPIFAAWIAITHIVARRAAQPVQHIAPDEPTADLIARINALPAPESEPEPELAGVR
jgi:hypothetical protein